MSYKKIAEQMRLEKRREVSESTVRRWVLGIKEEKGPYQPKDLNAVDKKKVSSVFERT